MKQQNNFDFYRKHVVKHIKTLVYTCKLYYLCGVTTLKEVYMNKQTKQDQMLYNALFRSDCIIDYYDYI